MDDTISRQAAIDALEKVAELFPWRVPGNRDSYDRYNEAWNDSIGRAEIEIEKLPSAQRWIPCSERLPETSGQYYVSGGGKVWICEFLIISTPIGGRIGGWCNNAANPIVQAWCPLPDSWKGEDNG